MTIDIETLTTHDSTDDCVVCRAQDIVVQILVPAVAAWETSAELPKYAIALHGAAGLLGSMMAEGISRDRIETALSDLLADMERQIAEDQAMGGPPQGTA